MALRWNESAIAEGLDGCVVFGGVSFPGLKVFQEVLDDRQRDDEGERNEDRGDMLVADGGNVLEGSEEEEVDVGGFGHLDGKVQWQETPDSVFRSADGIAAVSG